MKTVLGSDGVHRCAWGDGSALYRAYHDHEWGLPVVDDAVLFEKICLEGFQSGLAWITVLRKRERFREVFAGFDPAVVARFDDTDVARLKADAGIIRHEGKIRSTINNARRTLEIQREHGSLATYVWRFEPDAGALDPHEPIATRQLKGGEALSKDLKKRGFTFVGPTTAYAFMQAMGLVNDHAEGCAARDRCTRARGALR